MDEDWTKMNEIILARDKSKEIPLIPLDTQKLMIWACKYKSISSIEMLIDLEELSIFAVEDTNFDFLSSLQKLKYLSLIHAKNIKNLDFLSPLKNLEVLILATSPSWDSNSRTIIVDSLNPIKSLKKLKHLELLGVTNEEKSLSDLYDCKNIETAIFSKYPRDEINNFYYRSKVIKGSAPNPFVV